MKGHGTECGAGREGERKGTNLPQQWESGGGEGKGGGLAVDARFFRRVRFTTRPLAARR